MKRFAAIAGLFLIVFLQGAAAWDQFALHEVCAHGDLVHGSSDKPHDASETSSHGHCHVLSCLGHALALSSGVSLSHPLPKTHSAEPSVRMVFFSIAVLGQAPKTSPPLA